MKLHQIKYSGYGEILYRDFSCVCSEGSYHTEHQKKHHCLIGGKNGFRKIPNDKSHNETKTKRMSIDIKEKYVHIHQLIDDMRSTLNFYFSPLIMNEGTKVDVSTLRLCSSGIPKDTTLYHAIITADGNCLPYSGSVIASGNEDGGGNAS
ncbi:hypothetical protein ACJMK2_042800 [Sinanodonta woodiana]|uniref:Uncharacterized protein n=1 Tax=Sinanodonta woodiana TaxID=1069815 RepID=A0ABD3VUX2_SINWO